MFSVYILQNSLIGRYYIGSTNNFERRLEEHNRGQTKSTRQKGTWNVIYTEQVATNLEAIGEKDRSSHIKAGMLLKS